VKQHIFENGHYLYMVGPVAPFTPESAEVEAYAHAEDLRKSAPNENLMWLRGQYVEADNPNRNGHEWTADELTIKSLTPMFMPITVMHDPATAVGLIADTKLVLPDADPTAPRARIDTTLALWKHRWPEVAAEAQANYEAGLLMQSMECLPQHYDCTDCGQRFPWMGMSYVDPNWCEHFKQAHAAANSNATRRLGNVTFTGVGLIFGTRGARGAYSEAHLDVLAAEVAEFHHKAKHDTGTPKPKARRQGLMEIEDTRYAELVAAEAKAKELEPKLADAETKAASVNDLEKRVETLEAEKAAEAKRADDAEKKLSDAEAKEQEQALATERFEQLGGGFKEKLATAEFTKTRLEAQAKTLSPEEWDARLKELEETFGVARDAGGEGNGNGDGETFEREAVASTSLGGGNGNGTNGGVKAPSREAVGSVVRGLIPKK
jgi:hypothetical protein